MSKNIYYSGKTHNYDFFFGDGEVTGSQIPIDYENLENLDASQWTLPQLPTEAFQPRQELPVRSKTPTDHFQSNKDDTNNLLNRTS